VGNRGWVDLRLARRMQEVYIGYGMKMCLYVWLCVVLLYVEGITRVYSGIVDWGDGGGDRSGM